MKPRWPFLVLSGLLVIGFGVLGFAGWQISQRLGRVESKLSEQPAATASSTPTNVELVPVVRQPIPSVTPSVLLDREPSAVATLVKRLPKPADDGVVAPERAVAAAVSLSADGWLATTWSALSGNRVGDLLVAWNGRTYPIQKAIHDVATDAVFLNIGAGNLVPTDLAQTVDVVPGETVWLEWRGQQFVPQTVTDTRVREGSDPVSSERAVRRFLVDGPSDGAWAGGAAWAGNGALVGLLETKAGGGWNVLPAGDLRTALDAVLVSQMIRHPVLGVRGSDLHGLVLEGTTSTLPMNGDWLRRDRRLGLPAVAPTGPAAKRLQEGDVLQGVERDILDGNADLGELLLGYKPGSVVSLSGIRDGHPFSATVTLGSADDSDILK